MNIPKSLTSIPTLTEIVLPGLVEPEGLIIHERPVPTPGKGQALVEMLATGVSFAEQQMRRGRYAGVPKFPYVLGYDLVGVVAAVGPQVDESLVGGRVAAVVKTGGWTTYALVDALRAMGAEPINYNDPELSNRVRQLAPGGVDAVFDQLGGPSFERSFKLLAPGGTLVAYGMAAQRDDTNNVLFTLLGVYGRLGLWSLLPNRRRALFYNFWGGKHIRPRRFWQRLASDLSSVFSLLSQGFLTPQVAARIPLAEASKAMTLAESRTAYGKVVLVP